MAAVLCVIILMFFDRTSYVLSPNLNSLVIVKDSKMMCVECLRLIKLENSLHKSKRYDVCAEQW